MTIIPEIPISERGLAAPIKAQARNRWRGQRQLICSGPDPVADNERYTGVVRWNTSEWVKDPDTGKRNRRERPRSDWHEYRDEAHLSIKIQDYLLEQHGKAIVDCAARISASVSVYVSIKALVVSAMRAAAP